MRRVVDTNVPIIANGRADSSRGAREPTIECRLAAVDFLVTLISRGRILLDTGGEIQREYHRHLKPKGEPGVGDRFYLEVIRSSVPLVERAPLPMRADGSFADFPSDSALDAFDPSDRKFAALARRENVPVANATDSDWLEHRETLGRHGIEIDFVCGCNPHSWFEV